MSGVFEGLKQNIKQKAIEIEDGLRDNLALDSIAKAEIIEGISRLEYFVLGLVDEAKTELQKLLKELTSDEIKEKTWNVWVREFVAFQKARELIEKELLGRGTYE